ncbi:MAG: hypothetical protein GXO58_03030 [Thermodesulfobacteria bacterium]|nr:hypothetical protein [Thermodesulfobacteriota bacterium]
MIVSKQNNSCLVGFWLLLCFVLWPLTGCHQPEIAKTDSVKGCKGCHKISLDSNHNLKCTLCHKGHGSESLKDKAHKGLVASPSSPADAPRVCGECHLKEVKSITRSSHYTLKNEIATVWKAFFPEDVPPEVKDIHGVKRPRTKRELVMDMLARRCLRCHVYYEGDSYWGVRRGKGCAACHLPIGNRQMHHFGRPTIKNCLSCHYSNFVGWDYVGRFEKDYPEDFRAPLKKGKHIPRPYGIEWLPMTPDVHFRAGLFCTDCHRKAEFHVEAEAGEPGRVSCGDCHREISRRPGHDSQQGCVADCQSCHALWTFWDQGRSVMRQDVLDPEDWEYLYVQGSSEVEEQIKRALELDDSQEITYFMTDKFSGLRYPGLWFAGFERRRWAPVVLGKSSSGRISVLRPLLDLSLSYADDMGETVFDNLRGKRFLDWQVIYPSWPFLPNTIGKSVGFLVPYRPHSIGKADMARSISVINALQGCSLGD